MRLNVANQVTLLRLFLVPLLAMALLYRRHDLTLLLFVAAAVSDGVDGYLARRLNQRTQLGAILDPLADKAMILTACVILAAMPEPFVAIPMWLVALIVFRDALIVVGIGILNLMQRPIEWGASWASKVNTNVQIFLVVSATLANALIAHGVEDGWLEAVLTLNRGLIWGALVTTAVSGVSYTRHGLHLLHEEA